VPELDCGRRSVGGGSVAQQRRARVVARIPRPRDIAETAPAHDPIGPHPFVRGVLGLLLGAVGGSIIVAVTKREGR
jgi:hypothetical protein